MDPLTVLQSFHGSERRVFDRLLSLGKVPYMAKKIIALWLWIEIVCHCSLLIIIQSYPNRFFHAVAAEAEACLAWVENFGTRLPPHYSLPLTTRLMGKPIELSFFIIHRETARSAVSGFLNGVCGVVFEDIIRTRACRRNALGRWRAPQRTPFGECSSSRGAAPIGTGLAWASTPSMLLSQLSSGMGQVPTSPFPGPWTPMGFELIYEERRASLFGISSQGSHQTGGRAHGSSSK